MISENITFLNEERIALMEKSMMLSHDLALPVDRLREVYVRHYDFDGRTQTGSLVVFDVFSMVVESLFKDLYNASFPIYSVKPISEYGGNDNASMDDNNSSCYNPRYVGNRSEISSHALGGAIDINPIQNPYIMFGDMEKAEVKILPIQSKKFLNRKKQYKGMVEPIVDIFSKYGFTLWGGDWDDIRIDYHHFQVPYNIAKLCCESSFTDGMHLFENHLAKN